MISGTAELNYIKKIQLYMFNSLFGFYQ